MHHACVDVDKRGPGELECQRRDLLVADAIGAISPPFPKNTKLFALFQFSITFRLSWISDGSLSDRRLSRHRAREMLGRRVQAGGISTGICNHSFRATGITAKIENPEARVEVAQYLAGHADPKTTKLHDRRDARVSLDEIERIGI